MNCQRRDTLRALAAEIKAVIARLEEVRDDEENALAAMPEAFQFSTRGEAMEEAVREMDAAIFDLTNARESLLGVASC